jgi:hypothetical protein
MDNSVSRSTLPSFSGVYEAAVAYQIGFPASEQWILRLSGFISQYLYSNL